MKIQVTAEHIAKGGGFRCPIELAMGKEWAAGGRGAFNVKTFVRLAWPPEARQFIRAFDAGRPVQPFEFEL